MMTVLTIQSHVASGYVGNAAAVPALQALGVEAVAVDTAHLSNHPAHGSFEGGPASTTAVAALLRGVETKHSRHGFAVAMTGYLAETKTGRAALNAIRRLKSVGHCGLYCLDPVSGDKGRVYVDDGLIDQFRDDALPMADIVVPNAFESGLLLDTDAPTAETAPEYLARLRSHGPARAVITGIDTPNGVATIAGDDDGVWLVETERIDAPDSGAGDVFAALLVGHLVGGTDFPTAVARAVASVRDVLVLTDRLKKTDLALVEGFDFLSRPKTNVAPTRIDR